MRHEYQACKADALETCRLDKKEDFTAHCLEQLAFNCHESGLEEAFAVRMTLYDARFNEDAEYVQKVFDSQYDQTLKATWPLKHVKPSQLLTYKTEAFLNSRYELRKNVMTGVAQFRSKDSYDYKFYDLTKEVMNTMSIRALKAGLDSWDKDIKRYVESLGMRGRGYRVDEERLGSLRVPGLILMDVAGFRHFVVLKRVDDGEVELGDPILGNRRLPIKEFLEAWPSRAVFVVIGADFDRNTVLLQPSARPSARALYARQGPITDAELLDFGFTHADLF